LPSPQTLAHAQTDFVKPTTQRPASVDRAGSLSQRQERRLERILSIVGITDQPAAKAENHWSVAMDEQLKRRLIALLGKPIQQHIIIDSLGWTKTGQTPNHRQQRFHHPYSASEARKGDIIISNTFRDDNWFATHGCPSAHSAENQMLIFHQFLRPATSFRP
jgi:hypothetical protein